MIELKCPNCYSALTLIKEPDIELEKCIRCHGVFLDKGELNLYTSGRSITVELNLSDYNYVEQDKRICPKCSISMRKVQLMNYSGIVFDFCDNCNGFFLDNLVDDQIHDYLRNTRCDKYAETLREYKEDLLVRVDIEKGYSPIYGNDSIQTGLTPRNYIVISVFYKSPLNIDLLITPENILFKIGKILFSKRYIEAYSGDKDFDDSFNIHTNNESLFRSYINQSVINKTMDFIKSSPKLYNRNGNIHFYDNKITYREGAYSDIPAYKDDENTKFVINSLIDIVKQINKTLYNK